MIGQRRGRVVKKKGPRVNDDITASEVRLVGDKDAQYGIVSLSEAKRISDEQGLDLIEVSPNAKPPVVKLIDYGKYKYQLQKQANEAKKKTAQNQLKEIQFRPKIDVHDLDVKLKRAEKFLDQGDKVKMLMQFRGREMVHKDIGLEKFKEIIDKVVNDFGAIVESQMKMMGNRAIVMLAPSKKKK